ncbi:MAG: LacI family DNA-binding transcriptional regulator [Bacillota bacterium]
MTLKEVANKAGVSVSTVSRVINSGKEKSATKEVRDRIWKAVEECGYTPNKSAQSLKLGNKVNSNIIEVSILFARAEDKASDYFFLELAEHVKEELIKQGMKIGKTYFLSELKNQNQTQKQDKNQALVVLGRVAGDCKEFLSSFGQKIIYVSLNQMRLGSDHIVSDGQIAAEIAMAYLHESGHSKIAYVGEFFDEVRYRGYRNYLITNKLKTNREYVINTHMTRKGGHDAVSHFLKIEDMPTAIFCANDVTAFGVIEGLKEQGINVPKDLSVVSIDNIKEAENFKVPLTTVEIPLKEMGSFAVKTLKDRIEKGHSVPLNIFAPAKLIVRESVRKI